VHRAAGARNRHDLGLLERIEARRDSPLRIDRVGVDLQLLQPRIGVVATHDHDGVRRYRKDLEMDGADHERRALGRRSDGHVVAFAVEHAGTRRGRTRRQRNRERGIAAKGRVTLVE
jgi:hypothetical protein